MSDRDPLTAVVRLSASDELGEAMRRLRIWLDGEKIQPAVFATGADAAGYTFTIGFRSAQDANRFRTGWLSISAASRSS
jgi:hypothetical protein